MTGHPHVRLDSTNENALATSGRHKNIASIPCLATLLVHVSHTVVKLCRGIMHLGGPAVNRLVPILHIRESPFVLGEAAFFVRYLSFTL